MYKISENLLKYDKSYIMQTLESEINLYLILFHSTCMANAFMICFKRNSIELYPTVFKNFNRNR